MKQKPLLTDSGQDGVIVATLNRPTKANARNEAMQSELLAFFEEVCLRDDVRAIVLTGAGDRAFCGGMDLSESGKCSACGCNRIAADFAVYDAMETCPKPIVVAVNGAAVGGGFDLVLASDLAVAEAHATFRCPEAPLGLVPVFAMLRLPSIVGPQRAAALMLETRTISASEAESWGLVAEVVSRGESLKRALTLAGQLAVIDHKAIQLLKAALKGIPESVQRKKLTTLAAELFETKAFAETVSRFRDL